MRVIDVVQMLLALAAVLGLMWLLARWSRRSLGARGMGSLDVLARQPLTRGASVAVVRVADRTLVLGVTDQHVTLLTEADPEAITAAIAAAQPAREQARTATPVRTPAIPPSGRLGGSVLSPATWRATAEYLRERTVRRG